MTEAAEQNPLADLDLTPVRGLMVHVPEPHQWVSERFLSEYGARITDDALLFHFFAPPGKVLEEDESFISDLEASLTNVFPLERFAVKGGYVEDLDSVWVIVPDAGMLPHHLQLAEKFLSGIPGGAPERA